MLHFSLFVKKKLPLVGFYYLLFFFCTAHQQGGKDTHFPISEVGAVATKKKHSRRLLPGDSDYKLSKKPGISKRSPYPSRPLETKVVREEDLDDEVSGTIGSNIESEVEVVEEREDSVVGEMARREESEIGTLLKYLLEKAIEEQRSIGYVGGKKRRGVKKKREFEQRRLERRKRRKGKKEGLRMNNVGKQKGLESKR